MSCHLNFRISHEKLMSNLGFYIVNINRVFVVNDVKWALLSFGVDLANIKRSDGLRNHEKANQECNKNRHLDGATPIQVKWVIENILVNNTENTERKTEEGDKGADVSKNQKRSNTNRNEAIDGKTEKFIKIIVGLSGITRAVNVVDVYIFETNPVDKTAIDAIMLGELVVFFYYYAIEQTIVG